MPASHGALHGWGAAGSSCDATASVPNGYVVQELPPRDQRLSVSCRGIEVKKHNTKGNQITGYIRILDEHSPPLQSLERTSKY